MSQAGFTAGNCKGVAHVAEVVVELVKHSCGPGSGQMALICECGVDTETTTLVVVGNSYVDVLPCHTVSAQVDFPAVFDERPDREHVARGVWRVQHVMKDMNVVVNIEECKVA